MKQQKIHALIRNMLITILLLGAAMFTCFILSSNDGGDYPYSSSVFMLAVLFIARFTDGYAYGIFASCAAVVWVNYMFTYPFFEFNLTISGYPITFAVMLIVSVITSALTTQIKKQEQLRFEVEKEKMRADLLRSVSHDLRTPLTSISGSATLLLEAEDLPEADRRDILQEISKDAQWLIRITENILSVTKFSGSGVQLKKESEVVEEVLGSAILKFRKNNQNIPIHVQRPDDILFTSMDATLIEQVILNLLENAATHGSGISKIDIGFFQENDRIIFSIEDDGLGFPPHMLPHAFDGSTNPKIHSDNKRNMGIGLSVCRSIVLAHGGDISAYNKKNGGAGVKFWLPCEENEHAY